MKNYIDSYSLLYNIYTTLVIELPMNKVQVGSAPSPNLKVVRSKVGSLQNTSHKPGGGQVKIENRKLEWKAGTRVEAKNDAYVPGGGDKKVIICTYTVKI